MQGIHMHKPNWVHWHRPNWHTLGVHLDHVIHDPRVWAGLVLAILVGLIILMAILSDSADGTPMRPLYPMSPYMS